MSAIELKWTQAWEEAHTHCAADETEMYYCTAPAGASLEDVATAFLHGYQVQDDYDGTPIQFVIEDFSSGISSGFSGRPNESAHRYRPY